MKITILKNNLKNGLGVVGCAIAENNNLPVLRNVLIKTSGDHITLSATNLEIGVTTNVAGKIIEAGAISVPFATLYNIVSNLQHERIDCEVKQNTLYLSTDSYDAKIQGVPENDFPIIPKPQKPSATIEFPAQVLTEAFGQVVNAAQVSEVMPEISGALMFNDANTCKLVATDSFRLAEKTIFEQYAGKKEGDGFRAIIPLKTVQEAARIFSGAEMVRISFDSAQILFKTAATELVSRAIDGKYPDYQQIVPKTSETEALIEKEPLLNALKLVSSFSGKINDVYLTVDAAKKTLAAHSANQLLGENNYLIPAKIKGPDIKSVAFNWRYLVDGLRAIRGNQALLAFNGDAKPAVVRSPEDASYFYIIMPIRNS